MICTLSGRRGPSILPSVRAMAGASFYICEPLLTCTQHPGKLLSGWLNHHGLKTKATLQPHASYICRAILKSACVVTGYVSAMCSQQTTHTKAHAAKAEAQQGGRVPYIPLDWCGVTHTSSHCGTHLVTPHHGPTQTHHASWRRTNCQPSNGKACSVEVWSTAWCRGAGERREHKTCPWCCVAPFHMRRLVRSTCVPAMQQEARRASMPGDQNGSCKQVLLYPWCRVATWL
jgi:hypothetical protein